MLLSNLIKTRLRASRLCLLICCISMIALSIIGAIVTPLSTDYELFDNLYESTPAIALLLQGALAIISQLSVSGITTAMSVGTIFLYYSMFTMYGTQSAYLYFTLPRSRRDIFHASLLTFTIESAILNFVGLVSLVIYGVSVGIASTNNMPDVDYPTPDVPTPEYFDSTYVILLLLSILLAIIGITLLSVITPATCCIYGCSTAKKHKLVGTIVASFAVNAIQSTILGVALFFPMLIYVIFASQSDSEAVIAYIIPFILFLVGIATTVLAVVMYFMTRNRLEKKFDIE